MASQKIKRFWINEDEYLAHYLCVNEAPHILEYIEGKHTVQIKAEFLNQQNTDLAQNILLAADVCPMPDAIMIELEDGTFFNGYS
jgi:ferredoxin